MSYVNFASYLMLLVLLTGCTEPSYKLVGVVQNGLTGEPIQGVNVSIQGASRSEITNRDGCFSLTVPKQAMLGTTSGKNGNTSYPYEEAAASRILLDVVKSEFQSQEYQVFSNHKKITILLMPAPNSVESKGYLGIKMPQTDLLEHEVQWENIIDGVRMFYEKRIEKLKPRRRRHWDRDTSSTEAYEKSVAPNRDRFRSLLGAIDKREHMSLDRGRLVAETKDYTVYEVRWPVLKEVAPGPPRQDWPDLDVPTKIYGEGLLLEPKGAVKGYTIAIPDADQEPEDLVGLNDRVDSESQFARRFVENGFAVVVPVIADRTHRWSRNTNRPSRTWIYSQAHELGRTIAGYEVQKMEALVDWFDLQDGPGSGVIGIAGYGEGGLLALYTAALDTRIKSTMVSGYFAPREKIWKEPIYRNIWGLLREFGDAELASLIAPRSLVVEYSKVPEYSGPPTEGKQIEPPGKLWTPFLVEVESEFDRINALVGAGFGDRYLVKGEGEQPIPFGSSEAVYVFLKKLGLDQPTELKDNLPQDLRNEFDPGRRMGRMVEQLTGHTQLLLRNSEYIRSEFVQGFNDQNEARQFFKRELIGWLDDDLIPANVRTKLFDVQEKYTCYEVLMDVLPDVQLWGIITIPRDIPVGEKRPVVVLQHGRGGDPTTALSDRSGYYEIGRKLAARGFIVFTPFGNWTGETRFRWIDRVAKTTKATLWSTLGRQHEQLINWLSTLPVVDPHRIGFYGKSIGGQAASLIVSMLPEYALSINCAYFNESARKESSIYYPTSFVYHVDSEMPMWNRGHTMEYAEMANLLIFPRPFMVEHGLKDNIAPPEWVKYEYEKVRSHYEEMGKPTLTTIDLHDGGHIINEEVSIPFLEHHLKR
ncbi:dienelactone hydrolase family protein [Membranicola marinus]|uniref:Dienelactone hydrolase family protein n=1 Tax=Membranihabitans marinus TaxID=1227546 RepID=A0A953LA05_9BACT|nr:dienelactone hydrolase family protein [Membranihabitans marinus]MBY5959400.1 dienelactone hydrolase family protein [Membranihabitans marinus]